MRTRGVPLFPAVQLRFREHLVLAKALLSRGKAMSFSKPPKTYKEQLAILEGRGLAVPDRDFALHCLQHLNYYRLSAYRFPLAVQGKPDQFLKGTTFNDLWNLYHFDRTLRRLVLDAAKRVEISVRSRWAYVLGHQYGPQAYENPDVFSDKGKHETNLRKLDEELNRSKEDFVKHFREEYGMSRPPIWAACEVLSLGQVSHFFKSLKNRQDRKKIADTYGLDEAILASFLHHLTVVRNHAAHHARIWNRRFAVKPKLPEKPQELAVNLAREPEAEGRIHNTLVMLLYLLDVIEPESHLPVELRRHVQQLDEAHVPKMGFPKDWKDRSCWAKCQKDR